METLLAPHAYPAVQAAAIALALHLPGFDVNQAHPVTGDSFLQVLYRVYTSASSTSRDLDPLKVHTDRLFELLDEVDFTHANAKGQTIFHTITSPETFNREIPINMRRWRERRAYRIKAEANKAAGLEPPPTTYVTNVKKSSKFATAVFRKCLELSRSSGGLSWMEADHDGHMPVFDLAQMVKENKFGPVDLTRVLKMHARKISLATTNGRQETLLHLLFSSRRLYGVYIIVAVLMRPTMARLLSTADLYAVDEDGGTAPDILGSIAAEFPGYFSYQPEMRDALPRLLAAWRKIKLPSLARTIDRHLIKDLASIVCEYVLGADPPKVKELLLETTPEVSDDNDEEEKSALPVAVNEEGAQPMELDW